jgi:hypothetical protein
MRNARGARRDDETPADADIAGADEPTGAPFMHGGRRRSAREPASPALPPAEMVRLEAQRRRRQDRDELGSGAERITEKEFREAELVASYDPNEDAPPRDEPERSVPAPDARPPETSRPAGDAGGEPPPRGRRRRRGRRRPRGGGAT